MDKLKELATKLEYAMRNTWNGKIDADVFYLGTELIEEIRKHELSE